MSRTFRTLAHVLGAAAGAALFVATVGAQGPAGVKPSEQNFFIETPAGWTQPKTPWGDPDIQGMC